jgi:dTDP-4-amino-4,6-dideoxygalactose transaminase
MAAVASTMESGWLTTGARTREFEAAFAARLGAKHAIGLSSCTAGLHLALVAIGVGPGDEVIVPALNFVASAQCVVEVGATPVFCDVDPASLSIGVAAMSDVVTSRTRAVMPMHYAGHPLGMQALAAFARERGLAIIEDAALALGTVDGGEQPGARADVTVFSFYATKNLCTGEGGMAITNDDAVADRIRVLSLHGMDRDAWKRYLRGGSWRYDVLAPGFKYNMSDLCAAIGTVQLDRLEDMQRRRAEIAEHYLGGLSGIEGVRAVAADLAAGDSHSWCVFPIAVDPQAGIDRDALIDELDAARIGTSVHYIPTHTFAAYKRYARGPLPVADSAWNFLISLPLYPAMSDVDVADVLEALATSVDNVRKKKTLVRPRT